MAEPKNIRILQVAEKLFAEKGFDGTSIRDIASEAGANVSMISYYFGSKENLMKEIIRQKIDHTVQSLDAVMADTATTPVEKIEAFVDRFVNYKLDYPQFTHILMSEQLLKHNPEFAALMLELRLSLARHLETLLSAAARKGQIRKNVDVVLLISTLIGTVNNLIANRGFYKSYHQISGKKENRFDADYNRLILDHAKTLIKNLILDEK